MTKIKNPCVQVCRYDDRGICYGCKRTREEAVKWIFFNDDEKQQILININERSLEDHQPESNNYDHYV